MSFTNLLTALTYQEHSSHCKLENISLAGNKLFDSSLEKEYEG